MSRWQLQVIPEKEGKILRFIFFDAGIPLTYRAVMTHWSETPDFGAYFCASLAEVKFQAYFWETPPVWENALDQIFECVVVDSPALVSVRADQRPFREHFARANSALISTFPNLGKNATLVVPIPRQGPLAYPHLAAFLRRAAIDQQLALWQAVAAALQARISAKPVWVSTSGLGVHWLHVRLDDRPKYYTYSPYRRI